MKNLITKLYDYYINYFTADKMSISFYEKHENFFKVKNHVWDVKYMKILSENFIFPKCKICNIEFHEALFKNKEELTCNEYIIKNLLE